MDWREAQAALEEGISVGVVALREGRTIDAHDAFLAMFAQVFHDAPIGFNHYDSVARVAQAYRDTGRIPEGKLLLSRALEIAESTTARQWFYNGFLIFAHLARAWELRADEERLLLRELEFREKAGHAGSRQLLGQLVAVLKVQGKNAAARRAQLRMIYGVRYTILGILALLLGLALVVWCCGIGAALFLLVVGLGGAVATTAVAVWFLLWQRSALRHRSADSATNLLDGPVTLSPEWLTIDKWVLERHRTRQAVQLRFREDLPGPTAEELGPEYPRERIGELLGQFTSGQVTPGSPDHQRLRELVNLTRERNPSRWGAIGASGNRVLPEIELRNVEGKWHPLGGHGHLYRWDGSRWLCYSLHRDFASPGPFTALRIRAPEPVMVLQALWFCDDSF